MDKNTELNNNSEKTGSFRKELYDWMQSLVMALVACILIFLFAFRVIGVDGASMTPTLLDKDRVIISNLFYTPKNGDIVVLTKKAFSDDAIVKRVIATEGQTVDIDIESGQVIVDGVVLDEPYINETTRKTLDTQFPITVDEGCIFVMGDNRNRSTDSRFSVIGCVDTRCVLGRVYNIILPFSRFGMVK